MFNKEFNQFAKVKTLDIYPEKIKKEIDEAVAWIEPNI